MRPIALIAVLASSTAAYAEHDAIIWTSETTPEAAAAQLAKAQPALKATGLVLAEGWPRVIDSADFNGLKPGFRVILIGLCPSSETTRVLMRAKSAQRLSYVRKVSLTDAQAAEAQCPVLDASVKPPAVPAYLVADSKKNKLELESRIESLKSGGMLELPDGYPKVVETKTLKIAVPPGKTAEKFLLLLGVCEVTRAEVVLGAAQLYADWPAWALGDAALACPRVTDKGVPKALEKAIDIEDPDLVRELAERTSAPDARKAAAKRAAQRNANVVLKTLLSTFGKNPALATELLPVAVDTWAGNPASIARRRETVSILLEAGGTLSPTVLENAVYRCDLGLVKLFLEKGVKPDAKSDLLSKTLYCSNADVVNLLIEKGAVKLGGADDGHTLIFAQPPLRATLLKAGASLDAKDRGGLSLLDLVVLFPKKDDKARAQLLEARPALAAAFAGDGKEAIGGWTPVALAASTGDAAAVKKALDQGGKADAAVSLGSSPLGSVTPLALAIDARSDAAAAALLESGASATAASGLCCELRSKYSPEMPTTISYLAAQQAHPYYPFQREVVASSEPGPGWKPTSGSGEERWPVSITPLGRAAFHGQLATVKLLVEKGASLEDGIASLGLTPLMLAAQQNKADVFDYLLSKGAKFDAADAKGGVVLTHLAYGNTDVALVDKVLKKKKGIAVVKGLLTAAALYSNEAVVEALIKAGAGKNGEGKAAVTRLCSSGNPDREGNFIALEAAGFRSGQDWYGGCVVEGD